MAKLRDKIKLNQVVEAADFSWAGRSKSVRGTRENGRKRSARGGADAARVPRDDVVLAAGEVEQDVLQAVQAL